MPTTVPLHRSRSLAASLPCRATGWLVCVCTCDRCPSVCTSLRCPPRLPETACYRLPAAAAAPPPTRYSTAAFHATYLPPPNPTRLSTRLHQSTNPPSQPAIRYPGLSRRLPASHPSHSTQTSQTLSQLHGTLSSSLALPSLARLLPVALSRPLSSSCAWHPAASHSMRSW